MRAVRGRWLLAAWVAAVGATTCDDDGDDCANAGARSEDSLSWAVGFAFMAFVVLCILFDVLRTRLWWVYEPRLHHDSYRSRTPDPPGKGWLAWAYAVMRHWSDEDFLLYAGVDGLAMTYFLRYAMDVCFFSSVVGLVLLAPTYYTGRALWSDEFDDEEVAEGFAPGTSFNRWTIQNIRCRHTYRPKGSEHLLSVELDRRLTDRPLFPHCLNGDSDWRFFIVVFCAWLFTLRALSKLASAYQRFVHLRHWYLTAGLSRKAPPVEAQRALTVLVEHVPWRLRSAKALVREFERLCGAGSVHSAHVMIAGPGRR